MAKGFGFGKTILFGEHFVVYGLPAIISALNKQSTATVEKINKNSHEFIDNQTKFPGCKKRTWNQCQKSILQILNYMKIQETLRITLSGDLPMASSGIGSSAASCVALARAINNEFHLNWNDEQINKAAYQGEKEIHGNPSGIDNTAATYGGLFYFKKNQPTKKNIINPIQLKSPIRIVLADSGKVTPTKKVIATVKKIKQNNPQIIEAIFNNYQNLIPKALNALKIFDLKKIGKLMNKNHELLQKLTISCKELENMIEIAMQAGAFGAKLTGTGKGGLMLALTPEKKIQNKVAASLEKNGYPTLKTTIS